MALHHLAVYGLLASSLPNLPLNQILPNRENSTPTGAHTYMLSYCLELLCSRAQGAIGVQARL